MKTLRRLLFSVLALGVLGVATLAGTSYYYGGDDGMGCARCHEIRPMVDAWAASSHRGVACKDCHGSSFSADLRMHVKNLSRVWLHSRGETPEQIHIRHQDVSPLVERCGACHRQERADWESGPHGTPYAALFINPEHNAEPAAHGRLPALPRHALRGRHPRPRDPARPQGPVDVREARSTPACRRCRAWPATPSTARASPSRRGATAGLLAGPAQEIVRPSLALYDRRALEHVGLDRLPMPAMKDGERPVKTSPDRRQALCYQCHAPRAGMQVFSGDDRTPVGVHEGLSCLACHEKHGQSTRASCAGCHPRLSNCGIDVEKMDTTFKSPDSLHDVHRVACLDCHPKGVPKKRTRGGPAPG